MQEFYQNFLTGLQETPMGIWLSLALFIVAATLIILKNKSKTANTVMNTKMLTFGAMCMALSFILSYIKLFEMPRGGSVTAASMLPILFFAFVAGPSAGIIAGTAYGFLQFFQKGYAEHWLSLVLDYPLAFACLGLIAFAPKLIKSIEMRFIVGTFFAIFARYISHVISGAVFFAEYAGDMNPWLYSMIYNSGYLSVEFIITIVIGLLIIRTPVYKTIKVSFNSSL